MKGQQLLTTIQDWIINEPLETISAYTDWNGSYQGWITIYKEDNNRFTYQYGREMASGKWKTIKQLDNISYDDLIKQIKRLRTDYFF